MQSKQLPHMTVPRHWCPHSETYAGADCLLTHFQMGWKQASSTVLKQQVALPTTRFVTLYRFILRKGDETRTLYVIQNPAVERIIQQLALNVVVKEADKETDTVTVG